MNKKYVLALLFSCAALLANDPASALTEHEIYVDEEYFKKYNLDKSTLTKQELPKEIVEKYGEQQQVDTSNDVSSLVKEGNANVPQYYLDAINEKLDYVNTIKSEIEEKMKVEIPILIYLTSKTVPLHVPLNVIESVTRLQDIMPEFEAVTYYRGFEGNIYDFMVAANDRASKFDGMPEFQSRFRKNTRTKIDSFYFKALDVEKVPLIALATCKGKLSLDRCDVQYAAIGDMSLATFLTEVAKKDKKWEKAVHYLTSEVWE